MMTDLMKDRRDEWWEPAIYIEYFGGAAPVQAWGTVTGKPFYFRARHEAWSFGIALAPTIDPVDVQVPGAGFLVEESYGTNFAASYMPESDAEAIIRRCAQRFHEPILSEGRYFRQTKGKGYAARVEVCVNLAAPAQAIALACHGPKPSGSQGEMIEVPAEGFEPWKQGAVAGVAYALATAGHPSIAVTVTRIQGLFTYTNPTIIGAAAIDAVRKALKIEPKDEEGAHVSERVLGSWDRPINAVPEW
jgi:hypothetical protein